MRDASGLLRRSSKLSKAAFGVDVSGATVSKEDMLKAQLDTMRELAAPLTLGPAAVGVFSRADSGIG